MTVRVKHARGGPTATGEIWQRINPRSYERTMPVSTEPSLPGKSGYERDRAHPRGFGHGYQVPEGPK